MRQKSARYSDRMDSRLTRRQLAAVLAVPALAPGQSTPPVDDPAGAVQQLMQQNAQALAKVDVPIDVEPVTHFRA